MNTIKKFTATSAITGALGLAALGVGDGLAAAAPAQQGTASSQASAPDTSGASSQAPDNGGSLLAQVLRAESFFNFQLRG
jgi:hypothetical protein